MIKLLPATRSNGGRSEAFEYADSGQSNDSGLRRWSALGGSAPRRILQLGVDSISVVVVDVFVEKTLQVFLIHHDHMIEELATGSAGPSLGNPILPWTSKGRSLRLDSNLLDRLGDPF